MIRSWVIKSGIQRVLSVLPYSYWWNGVFQRHVTGRLLIERGGEFRTKLIACRRHLDYYRSFSRQPRQDFSVVEIGTGWFPIIPIGLYLCGAREVWSFDIVRLLRKDTFCTVIRYFCDSARSGELSDLLPGVRTEAVRRLLDLAPSCAMMAPAEFLELINIHTLVRDVRESGLESGIADIVLSQGVFELIEPKDLDSVLSELKRISTADSVMSHYICIADQFATFDKSITPFNNLQYSDLVWRCLRSPLVPQTRLRASDYRRIMREAGVEILAEEVVSGAEDDLARTKVAKQFRCYEKQDLLVLFTWLVGRSYGVLSKC